MIERGPSHSSQEFSLPVRGLFYRTGKRWGIFFNASSKD
jgi:hypothetical protein